MNRVFGYPMAYHLMQRPHGKSRSTLCDVLSISS